MDVVRTMSSLYANKQLGEIKQAVTSLTSLAHATVALQGLNIAVSAAGFAVVCHKLNRIADELHQVREMIAQVLALQQRAQFEREMERYTYFTAQVENLARGLRMGDPVMTGTAINDLTVPACFQAWVCEQLLKDPVSVYRNPKALTHPLDMVLASRLAQAHAFAALGHLDEALQSVGKLAEWQAARWRELEAPLGREQHDPPIWMGRLPMDARRAIKDLVTRQAKIPEALAYLQNELRFCLDHGVTPAELAALDREKPLLLIVSAEPTEAAA
jgi:hypothetical protein